MNRHVEEEEIVVDIDRRGGIKVSTPGSRGKSCKDLSKFIEQELGEVTEIKKTAEYYQRVEPKPKIKLNQG